MASSSVLSQTDNSGLGSQVPQLTSGTWELINTVMVLFREINQGHVSIVPLHQSSQQLGISISQV